MYQTGGLITHNETPDFNSLKNRVRAIFADVNQGEIDDDAGFGYGQDTIAIVNDVLSGDLITAAQWNTLYGALYKCLRHQGTTFGLPTPEQVAAGDIIFAYSNTLDLVTLIEEERFALSDNPSEYTITPEGSSQRSTSWGGVAKHEFTLTFADYDEARYFFNSGSSVRMDLTSSGSNPTPSDLLWDVIIGSGLSIEIYANETRINSAVDSDLGFYDVGEVNTALTVRGNAGSSLLVDARRSAYTAAPFVLTVELKLINVDDEGTPPPSGDFVTYLSSVNQIGTYNRLTGQYTFIGITPIRQDDIAYDGQYLWCIGLNGSPATGVHLTRRNPNTAELIDLIGVYPLESGFNALCTGPGGSLYMVSGANPPTLYSVNKTNGTRTVVTTIAGVSRSEGDIFYDQQDQVLRGIARSVGGDSQLLYSVDLNTNTATLGATLNLVPGDQTGFSIQGLVIEDGVMYGYDNTLRREYIINKTTGRLTPNGIVPVVNQMLGAAHSSEALLNGITPPTPCSLTASPGTLADGQSTSLTVTTGSVVGSYNLLRGTTNIGGPYTAGQTVTVVDTPTDVTTYNLSSPSGGNCASTVVRVDRCLDNSWVGVVERADGSNTQIYNSGTLPGSVLIRPGGYVELYVPVTTTPYGNCSLYNTRTFRVYQGSTTSGPEIDLTGTGISYPFIFQPFRTSAFIFANICHVRFFFSPSDLNLANGAYTIRMDGCPRTFTVTVF